MARFNAALDAARGLLESTGSETGSLRQRTNSTSSQPGEEVVAALATPVHCKLAVKNAEVTIASHIQGLKDAVEQEDLLAPAALKERHAWIISSELENLSQIYLRWAVADIAKEEEISGLHTASVAKFNGELNTIWRDIVRKTPPDPTPPPSPTQTNFSNTSQKQTLAFKKRELPRFSGEATDYPRFKKLWKAVEGQFDDVNQTEMIKGQVTEKIKAKIKICSTMKEIWTRLDDEFGRADEVALTLIKGFSKLTLSGKSEHERFVQLFDKAEEIRHDLKEIDRDELLKDPRAINDVIHKMSKDIRNLFHRYEIVKKDEDHPTEGRKLTRWETLWNFMEEQVEVSRKENRINAGSHAEKETDARCFK